METSGSTGIPGFAGFRECRTRGGIALSVHQHFLCRVAFAGVFRDAQMAVLIGAIVDGDYRSTDPSPYRCAPESCGFRLDDYAL
jgi:hypothetical protein